MAACGIRILGAARGVRVFAAAHGIWAFAADALALLARDPRTAPALVEWCPVNVAGGNVLGVGVPATGWVSELAVVEVPAARRAYCSVTGVSPT
jgi:hypothetical protein